MIRDKRPALRHPALAPGLALSACGVLLALWTRRAWCDPLIDFGVQLYVPWRLADGQVLFRDLAWYNGPLSAYLNSLLFRLTGPSLIALSLLNLALVAAICALLYTLLRAASGRAGAFFGCLFFLCVHAFGQLLDVANYNFVNPYYHDVTHGILLGLAALFCLRRWRLAAGAGWLSAAGLLTGLAFLTKAEVFLAVAAGVGGDLWLSLLRAAEPRRGALRALSIFTGGLLVPIVITFLAFLLVLPAHEAALAVCGSWPAVLQGKLLRLAFFRDLAGVSDLAGNAVLIGKVSLWYGAAIALLGLVALKLHRRGPWILAAEISLAALTLGAVLASVPTVLFDRVARALPVAMAVSAVGWLWFNRRTTPTDAGAKRQDSVLCFSLSVFALVLLAKIFFAAGFQHYGFALSMPAAALSVAALTGWIPRSIQARGGRGSLFRWIAGAGAVAIMVGALSITSWWLQQKTVRVGRAGDTFRSDWRGEYLKRMLAKIEQLALPEETLLVLPEGVMVNYLARRINPTPYTNFMPTELTIFSESRMLAALAHHPPDWVLLIEKDTLEFGFRYFGQDYGLSLRRWIEANYLPVHLEGAAPFSAAGFGMLLLRRAQPQKPA